LRKELQAHADDLAALAKALSATELDREATDLLQAVGVLNGVHTEYAAAMAKGVEGSIHTPSLVVSWVVGKRAGLVRGGHNIDAKVVRVEADGAIRAGSYELKPGREMLLRVHPDDVGKASRAVRALARGTDVALIEKAVRASLGGPAPPRRPLATALSLPPENKRPRPADIFRRAALAGWEPSRESPPKADVLKLRVLQEVNEHAVLVIREGKGKHRIVHGKAAKEGTGCHQVDAWTYEDTVDALGTLLDKSAEASRPLDIHVQGFEDWEFEGLRSALRIRGTAKPAEPRPRVFRNTPEAAAFKEGATKEAKVAGPRKVETKASADGKVFTVEVKDASLSLRVEFEKPVPKGRIKRFLAWLTDLISGFFARGGNVNDLDTFLRKEISQELQRLKKDGVNLEYWRLELQGKGLDLYIGREDGQHGQPCYRTA
jgi:hypothetical protein